MNAQLLEIVAKLRIAVGFLGEHDQNAWWSSHFFGTASKAFLAPVFHRTLLLTQYHGVVQAASRIHDEPIGVGKVYHLFRLPEDLEYGIHTSLHQADLAMSVAKLAESGSSATSFLIEMGGAKPSLANDGPARIGTVELIRSLPAWSAVAAHYAQAFQHGIRTYPYFLDAQ